MNAAASEMHKRILEEAARLFVGHGYPGISMRQIAAAVGLSKAGLYYHFEDKEHLLLALLQEHLAQIEAVLVEASGAADSTREQVAQLLYGIFALPPAQRSVIRLASQEVAHLSPAARQAFTQQYQRRFIARIEAIFQAGIDRGEIRSVDARLITWLLLGMAYPFFYPSSDQPRFVTEDVINVMVESFFDGLAAR